MSKINSAESIRGLACLAVVFSHLALTFFPYLHNFSPSTIQSNDFIGWIHHSPFAFFYSGTAAVFIFFVLSGYILSYAILRKNDVVEKIQSMTLKRYPRLAIPALVSCIIAWIVFKLNINTTHTSEWFQRYGKADGQVYNPIYDGLINSFLFGESTYNWVLWTMQIELLASFAIFLLLFLYIKNKYYFYIFSFILPIVFFPISPLLSLGIYSFVIGAYIYIYGKKTSLPFSILVLIFGLYLAGIHNTSHSYSILTKILGSHAYTICNFFAGIFIVYSILMSEKLSNILDKPLLVYLGKLSFSIYLLHLIVLYSIGIPSFNLFLSTDLPYILSAILSCIITMLVTILASIPYSKYVDNLSIRVANLIEESYKSRKLKSKKSNTNNQLID